MGKRLKGMSKSRQKEFKAKYNANTLTKSERDEWWSFRLKQMRDEYCKKKGGLGKLKQRRRLKVL
jgi:hypothetical protein